MSGESSAEAVASPGSEATPEVIGGKASGVCSSMRPWRLEGHRIVAADGDTVAEFDSEQDYTNAELIVEAVNGFQAPGEACYPPMLLIEQSTEVGS